MLVMIAGYATSGKDTIADYLVEKGIVSRKYNFALPLKEMINVLFDWDDRHAYGELKEETIEVTVPAFNEAKFKAVVDRYGIEEKYGVSSEKVFELTKQGLGLFYMNSTNSYCGCISPRKAYQLFGTEIMREGVADSIWIDLAPTDDVVIPDLRFPNEDNWGLTQNAMRLRVNRQDVTPVSPHSSEQYIETFDIAAELDLDNNGTLEELYEKVDSIFGK